MRPQTGFTLIEAMVVIVITAILLAVAMPSMARMFEEQRLKNAAEQLYGDMQLARSAAIQQNRNVSVTFDAAAWCYIAHVASDPCACGNNGGNCSPAPAASNLKNVAGSDFRGVALSLPGNAPALTMTFEPQRGMLVGAANNTVVSFALAEDRKLGVLVNPLGRVRLCSPTGSSYKGHAPC